MNFIDFIKDLFKNKKKEELKEIKIIEEQFEKGEIILPNGHIDYENFEEFKNKTSHISIIQNKLKIIEGNKPKNINN